MLAAARAILSELPRLVGDRATELERELRALIQRAERGEDVTGLLEAVLARDTATCGWMYGFLEDDERRALSGPSPPPMKVGTEPVEAEQPPPEAILRSEPSGPLRRPLRIFKRLDLRRLTVRRRGGPLPGGAGGLENGDGPENGDGDPPRSAYGLLRFPELAVVGRVYELTVGLAPKQEPGVAGGPLERPESSVGPYWLDVDVDADGFGLRDGEAWRNRLRVTAEHAYPTLALHLTALQQEREKRDTKIEATFSVEGQTIGLAVRYVIVAKDRSAAAEPAPETAAGISMRIPTSDEAPDLTVRIRRWDSASGGRLRWSVESPHRIKIPEPTEEDIGTKPSSFAEDFVKQMALREGRPGMHEWLLGRGRQIARHIPGEVVKALRDVARRTAELEPPRVPTCLILSQEPYVPWELAVIDPPLDPAPQPDGNTPKFLAEQAIVGRWLLRDRPPPPTTPPTDTAVRKIAVIVGNYEGVPGWRRLVEAEAEAVDLERDYGAATVDAAMGAVLDCLKGDPEADLLHFAVHGKYDETGLQRGMALIDRQMLDSAQVEAYPLKRRPFVFLNACQVGSGEELLGDYAGMAASFLYAGAAGVIAPLWSVDDKIARSVAAGFYERTLRGGEHPAEVLMRMRSETTASGNTSGTYLAYQFFGHPRMRLAHR